MHNFIPINTAQCYKWETNYWVNNEFLIKAVVPHNLKKSNGQ